MPTPPLVDEAIVKASDILGGKYRVERVLGVGGMGIVVAVHHIDLRTRFALKIMRPEAARDPESVERFLREARAAVQLKSEHCVRVVDVGRLENGSPYMVMEFLIGRDLGDVVAREGARSPAEAVDYVLQACEGIAEAHACGIIHRDLKPQNLFLTKNPDGTSLVKVLDFGLAKSLSTAKEAHVLTQTSAVMGSPVYMSPEQMRASRQVDARSDTWSLGVCLHELLTGRPPFEGATFPELCSVVLNEPPRAMPSDIPRGLAKIVTRCLEKNPSRRFATVADLAEALEAFAPVRGAAGRIRAVLAAPRELDPVGAMGDSDADMRSATTIDTLRRAGARRARWPAVALSAATLLTIAAAVAMTTRAPRHPTSITIESHPRATVVAIPPLPAARPLPSPIDESSADESIASAASAIVTTTPSTSGSSPLGAMTPSSPGSPTMASDLSKRSHTGARAGRRVAPPAAAPAASTPPPPAGAPVLKPKTTEF